MEEIDKKKIIDYIKERKEKRYFNLLGTEKSEFEHEAQENIFLGVDMVIRWIEEL